MLVKVNAAALQGIDAIQVTIEVNALRGIRFFLVGLPDNAVKESHERIRSALEFNGLKFPSKQIVVNMAPADIRKEGSAYDLPIAVGILAADGIVSSERLGRYMIMGELGLDGSVRSISGALPIAELAAKRGLKGCILPEASAIEASEYKGIEIYGVETLEDVLRIVEGEEICEELMVRNLLKKSIYSEGSQEEFNRNDSYMDFSEIIGQEAAKRGIEVAAAGNHNVIILCYLFTGFCPP